MTTRSKMFSLCCGALLGLGACSGESEPVTEDAGVDSAVAVDTAAHPDQGSPDTSAAPDVAATDLCSDPAGLAAEALEQGSKVLAGVQHLTTSTPIADLVAAPASFEGQGVRVEGWISEICQSQGCYVTLDDGAGNKVNLKVLDGVFDFRTIAQVGAYAVGEGVFEVVGEHGSQVTIMDGGAVIGPTVCPR